MRPSRKVSLTRLTSSQLSFPSYTVSMSQELSLSHLQTELSGNKPSDLNNWLNKGESGIPIHDRSLRMYYHILFPELLPNVEPKYEVFSNGEWKKSAKPIKELAGFVEMFQGNDLNIVDIGCGGGDAISELAKVADSNRFIGVEINGDVLHRAQPNKNLLFVQGSWFKLPLKKGSINRIISTEGIGPWGGYNEDGNQSSGNEINNHLRIVHEFNRISQQGTVMRISGDSVESKFQGATYRLLKLFSENGWDIYRPEGQKFIFIGIKR